MTNDLMARIKKCKAKIVDNADGSFTIVFNDNGYKLTENGNWFRLEHLYGDFVGEYSDEEDLVDAIKRQVGNFSYACGFGVTGFIHPGRYYDAKDYLGEDNMLEYYDGAQKSDIKSIEWCLEKQQSGRVYIDTTARLTKAGLNDLKSFIDGQNSDGLGEGFEQQDFITMRKNGGGDTLLAGNIYKYSGFESTK